LHDIHEGINYIINHKYIKASSYSLHNAFLVAAGCIFNTCSVACSFGSDVWRLTSIEVLFWHGGGGGVEASWADLKQNSYNVSVDDGNWNLYLAFGVIANFGFIFSLCS
jgi:DHA3 family macrolide efflux protein-like MFS transporter